MFLVPIQTFRFTTQVATTDHCIIRTVTGRLRITRETLPKYFKSPSRRSDENALGTLERPVYPTFLNVYITDDGYCMFCFAIIHLIHLVCLLRKNVITC